jgi:hypothetical protein
MASLEQHLKFTKLATSYDAARLRRMGADLPHLGLFPVSVALCRHRIPAALLLVPLFSALDAHYFIFPVCLLAVMQHLRSIWRATTSHNQQTYKTPETGVPWLVIIAQNKQRALFLEYLIMTLFVWYMANYGRIVYGPKFLTLSPDWRTWFINPSNAETFALLLGIATPFAYGLWNVAVSGVPFFRPREAATGGASPYRHVREESRRSPRLPSVKELSDNIGDFYS